MKLPRFLSALLLLLLFVIATSSFAYGKEEKRAEDVGDKDTDALEDRDAIEENPDYEQPDDNNAESDEASSSDDELVEDTLESDSIKSKVNNALAKSKKDCKKGLNYIKKNRAKITLSLAIFAFRREIRATIVHLFKNEVMDPKTGKLRVSSTSVLKLILFVDFMRRLQSGRNASQPGFQAIANLGQTNTLMGIFFSRVLRVPVFNPAFIPPVSQHYTFERINERYIKDGMALHKAMHAKHEGFKWPTAESAISRSMIDSNQMPEIPSSNETVVVVDMTGLDTSLSTMHEIRDQVSFLLSQYRQAAMMEGSPQCNSTETVVVSPSHLEVVVLLESPGGSAADYSLAAQQLLRLRKDPGITLTICVDKVAASGGYMMACTASPGQLKAAPFAVVGSIGVLGQIVNAQKLLEGWGLLPIVFRGGKDKAPLGAIGEVTKDGIEKTQNMIDVTHEAFIQHVVDARPILKTNVEKVCTGDIFIGKNAIDLGLIDDIITSDEYISSKAASGARVLRLIKNRKARFPFSSGFDNYDTTIRGQPRFIDVLFSNVLESVSQYVGLPAHMPSKVVGNILPATASNPVVACS